jgi:thiol-disulfide isomerase/thioredoxin/outer membrane lipoprotein-sorting protein
MFLPVILLLALAVPQTATSSPPKDALALLNEVSQRYADAKSYHIEAVEESTTSNDLSRHWDKRLLTAIVTPGGRYRYEGQSGSGSATLVSDGTTAWVYHPYDHLYTAQPASGNDPQAGRVISGDEMPANTAKFMVSQMAHRADRLTSAAFLPDETIAVSGKNVECYVVRYTDESAQKNDVKFEWTVWIDKSRKVVVKSLSRGDSYVLTMARGRIPRSTETTVTYTVVELSQQEMGQQEPDSSFRFVPPAEAKLVSEFPNDFDRSSVTAVDLTGKPAPDIQFKSSDGKIIPLSSFRGKPVFVEFWATWCGPSVDLMPGLTKLYAETNAKGLVWVSIDNDENGKAVAAFLSREHVSWPNYHDDYNSFGKAFHRVGIPLGVLVDADGKIAFYKTGYGIGDLRTAIAKLGPEFSAVAGADANVAGANSK